MKSPPVMSIAMTSFMHGPARGGLGFKQAREGEIRENTKDFIWVPKKKVEQPLTPGFAFEMCSDTALWDMLELATLPYRTWASKNWWRSCSLSQGDFVLSQEKEHPFNPESPHYAVPTFDILHSYKSPELVKPTYILRNWTMPGHILRHW